LKNLISFSLLFATLAVFASCGGGSGDEDDGTVTYTGDKTPGDYTWTIMVYLDGDNNLEEAALVDINEMELVSLTDEGVNVIVLVDRHSSYSTADGDWEGTRLYHITQDSNTSTINSTRLADSTYLHLTDTGDNEELNMGDPDTVTDFIDFCKTNYSADKYAFIFWNHGGGWRSAASLSKSTITSKKIPGSGTINKAVCWDETSSNNCLYMSEVQSAINGKGINVLGFDACLMSMVEVMYQLKDTGPSHVIASSATEPGSGWVYNRFLHQVINLTDNSELNVSKCAVDAYIDYTSVDEITLSVIELSKISILASAINTFATNLINADAHDDICDARYTTLSYSGEPFIDIYHFADKFTGSVGGAATVVATVNSAVVYHRDRGYTDAHGLSIYFPVYSTMDSEYTCYTSAYIDFPGAVQWDEFLADYYSDVTVYTIETFPNGGAGSSNTDTYIEIYSSDGTYIAANDDIDYDGGDYFSKLTLPLASGSTYYIRSIDAWGYTGPYSILFNIGGTGSSAGTPATSAYESNNTVATATTLPYNTVQDHYLTSGDIDILEITSP
ncbi:MAG TPA: clostripain-related cysteine peptidase, partial [Spirochaetota bacterium]|nr:clostripain-related cysteine peptidase [Spirochaetota bacterium]